MFWIVFLFVGLWRGGGGEFGGQNQGEVGMCVTISNALIHALFLSSELWFLMYDVVRRS